MNNAVLFANEQVVFTLEAPLWNEINNPIMRLLGNFVRFVSKWFMGFSKRGFLTVTNQRIIISYEEYIFWCIPNKRLVKSILPQSIKEVGYKMEKSFLCFCPTYVLYYEALTDSYNIAIPKGTEQQVADYANKFYQAFTR